MLRIDQLFCDNAVNPLGVDALPPRLSWKLSSSTRGKRQSAYQIFAATKATGLHQANLWNSDKIAGDATSVVYAGKPLASSTRVFWSLRVWDEQDVESPWSESAEWTTGVLGPTDWQAKWITAHGSAVLPIFRKQFAVRRPIERAVIHICGLGQHELFLNGRKVGTHFLSPGWTNYRKSCLYETLDLTTLLVRGENTLAVMLGNGFYNVEKTDRYTKLTGTFGPPKLIAQIELFFEDGSRQTIGSDASWRTTPGPITYSHIFGGEDHDRRLEPAGWMRSEFDDSAWARSIECDGPGGVLRGHSSSAPPLGAFESLRPVAIKTLSPKKTVYDFGQNASIVPRVVATGQAGAIIRVTPSELVHDDGTLDRTSCAPNETATSYFQCTLAGAGEEAWQPQFSYHGSRYLLVERLAAKGSTVLPEVTDLAAVVVHSTSSAVGNFSCSSDLFNRTRTLIRWAQRSNLVSVISDCPHRERLGWLEQYHLHGPSLRYEFDVSRLFAKTMIDVADSQRSDGLVPDIAPEYSVFKDGFLDSPEWGAAAVLVPWQHYEWTGDLSLLHRQYDVMRRYVEYLHAKSHDDLLDHGLGDWYDIGPKPPGPAQLTPRGLTATAFFHECTRVVAQAAGLLDRAEDAALFSRQAEDIAAAFNAKYFDAAAGRYASGSQTAQAIPLMMNLVPADQRLRVVDAMLADVKKIGLSAGDIGHRYLLRALADAGRSDVVFDLHSRSDRPGYGWILARGATALTEAWDAGRTSSQNHFMLGHITEWFYRDLAGIGQSADSVGFRKIAFRPTPVGDVNSATASYQSIRGEIAIRWKQEANRFAVAVRVPVGATAEIFLPTPAHARVTGDDQTSVTPTRVGDRSVIDVGSGSYAFTADWS